MAVLHDYKKMLGETWTEWNKVDAPRLGAALSYYTVLSLAPLVVVAITIAGWVLDQKAAQGVLEQQISGLVGPQGASAIQAMVQANSRHDNGWWAAALGFLTLLIGASSVVGELRSDLNKIWHVREEEGITALFKQRSYAVAIVLGTGFLLLVSLVLSAGLTAMGTYFQGFLPIPAIALELLNLLISLAVITGLFALMYKFLPDVPIAWRDVTVGAVATAMLFTVGKVVIGLYIGKAGVASTYGAAGSLIVVLIWVYYSAQIFFFGAAFTRVYACSHGSQVEAVAKAPAWQSLSTVNAGPLPILPSDLKPVEPEHTLAEDVGVIVGSTAALGRTIVDAFKGEDGAKK